MTRIPKKWLHFTMLVALSACAVPSVFAQVATAPMIKIKEPKRKIDSFRGEVMNCTSVAITVHDLNNVYNTRTFSFDPKLTRKMENRYMEKGARVTVKYIHMSDTAVALKGKILKNQ